MRRTHRMALAGVVLLAVATGCGSQRDSGATDSRPSGAESAGGSILVFAASSLKQTFTDIGGKFETDNPGASVEFSFAGSSDLVMQLTQGAQADVFASADIRDMDAAAQAGLVAGDPVNFASNTLTIVVAPGNPKNITSFEDLKKPDTSVVVCAPQVPCGSATQKIEHATGVDLAPVSEESNVTDVLNKVTTGQADAGLVMSPTRSAHATRSPQWRFLQPPERSTPAHRRAQAVPEFRIGKQIRRSGHQRGRPEGAQRGRLRQTLITATEVCRTASSSATEFRIIWLGSGWSGTAEMRALWRRRGESRWRIW